MRSPDRDKPDKPGQGFSRREFIKGVGLAAGGVALGYVPLLSAFGADGTVETSTEGHTFDYTSDTVYYAKPAPEGVKYGMVVDVQACIGCRRCAWACVKENNIGRNSGFTYIQLLEMEAGKVELETANPYYARGGDPEKWYLPVQCMHCDKPPCVQACPVRATRKEADGLVVQDYRKCIGCRLCMVNCPYHARHFNWNDPYVPSAEVNKDPAVRIRPKGVVEKCTFCIHRVRDGLETRCTEACPVRARKFGDLNDPRSAVSQMLKTRRLLFRLKEELGTEPSIYYVG
ncbi:MAG: 4Fe-4S dicluster domain-containing protein [Actinobacteria bacterium]|nr:MAG: 4Fe-4S dicluster domain-containing protein [Actinomycetota bacterium]